MKTINLNEDIKFLDYLIDQEMNKNPNITYKIDPFKQDDLVCNLVLLRSHVIEANSFINLLV